MFSFLQPKEAKSSVPQNMIMNLYYKYRFQSLIGIFIGYAAYYIVRNNFALSTHFLSDILHMSKTEIGLLSSGMLIAYGLSKGFMSSLADKASPAKFMAFGLICCAIINIFMSFADSLAFFLVLVVLNGFFQGFGVGPSFITLAKENKGPLKGIILDLRDDPGGLLNGAVGVSAAFLQPDATVVSTKGRNKKEGMVLKATAEDYITTSGKDPLAGLPAELKTIPMTVLINAGSASASEIVAGALQDHKRAVVVGTQSFGKGSVQTLIPLSGGSAVKLTTALYYTPNDRSIQAQGIVPDVEVKDKDRAFESREADLVGHIGNPLGGQDVNSSTETPANAEAKADKDKSKKDKDEDISSRRIPNPAKDDQLRKALDLVKNPAEWQKSLGLAAKKPAPKKDADKDSKK